jgi:membrane protein implicated in regulation of membrane protease activity
MGSELMRWIWLVVGIVLMVAELSTAALVLLPLALGAFAAAATAFLGGGMVAQLVVAAVVAAGSFMALRPLARRVERIRNPDGVGARRLVNASAVLLTTSDATGNAWVHVDGEKWLAELSGGRPPEPGERVRVLEVRGTHLVVAPFEAPLPPATDRQNDGNEDR